MHGRLPNIFERDESENSKTTHYIKSIPIQAHFELEGNVLYWFSEINVYLEYLLRARKSLFSLQFFSLYRELDGASRGLCLPLNR